MSQYCTSNRVAVLGSDRRGLIFTGLQEGAQLGGLTPPGQTEQGIPYHVLSCWVLVGGTRVAGTHSRLGSAQRREQLSGLCSLCCVFPFSVSLLFLFPLFAVLLNCPYPNLFQPTSFCLFLSILLCTPAGGGAVAWRFWCRPQPNQNSC